MISRSLTILESLTARQAAARLLGCHLIRTLDGQRLMGRIIETEAYSQDDPASHSYRGQTERNRVMFGRAGTAYVYFTYGMHYCLNVVVGGQGNGSAVLIRAVEPLTGLEQMSEIRNHKTKKDLCNGPAKLCQAFSIDLSFNGHDLTLPPLQLVLSDALPKTAISWTPRIGIRQATDRHWRAVVTSSPYLSSPSS